LVGNTAESVDVNRSLLFVAPSAYPLGGVQTWLDYLLPGLTGRGWRPVLGLVAGRFHDVACYLKVHPWPDAMAIPNPTGSAEGRIRALVAAVRRVQPELVLSVNIPDAYAAVERMRGRGEAAPRVVMTNHSIELPYVSDTKAWRHVIDGMVGTNRLTCRLATEWACLDPSRVHYAPYGVECPSLPVRRAPKSGPLRIAYSGRLDEGQKRVQDIPLILDRLGALGVQWELRVAGGGASEGMLRERLRPRIDAGSVQFLGVLNPSALTERLYDWANVLLLTSYWETGPIVIWEAMARGLPVVSSRYVGSGLEGSLSDGGNCLLFPVGDVQAAAVQLRRATDPKFRAALAEAGHRLVRERYTREHSVEAWDQCLRAIMAQPSRLTATTANASVAAGRLDRWLGPGPGETVRRLLKRRFHHNDPGGEWPHARSAPTLDERGFFRRAEQIDAGKPTCGRVLASSDAGA
jgi:glycosyltransferase involved in cell wall biosynthesis